MSTPDSPQPSGPHTSSNLAPHRGPSVWLRPDPVMQWSAAESERWCVAACGGALVAVGLRQRGAGGALMALAGGALAIRAMLGYHDLACLRGSVERLRASQSPADAIEEASDESFPASDAPSWTATAGAGVTTT